MLKVTHRVQSLCQLKNVWDGQVLTLGKIGLCPTSGLSDVVLNVEYDRMIMSRMIAFCWIFVESSF